MLFRSGAIRNTLENQETYEVSVFHEAPYPSNFSEFNLIILHQLPTAGKSLAGIIGKEEVTKIPILFLTGAKTFIPQLNAMAAGAEIKPLAGSPEESQAIINPAYGTFTLSNQFRDILPGFPPLMVPFANYILEPQLTPALYQKIRNVETEKPLLATGVLNGRKTGFLFRSEERRVG